MLGDILRLLHTSDWHLGQNFMGQSRKEEHRAFLDWLIEVIKSQSIDTLLVSGDIFDTGTPPNYALELYYNFLKEISSITSLNSTIITAGNHDSVATLKSPKELLAILDIHIIVSGDEEEDEVIPIYRDDKLQAIICAVPFLRDGVIRHSLAGQSVSEKERLANEGIKAYYQNSYQKAQKIREDRDIPIIAMGHLTTVGARSSQSERDIYIGGTLDIGGDYLGKLFDYVALGHLHINQSVGSDMVRYSGSPIPLSFSESKESKRVNIVSFDGRDIEVEELETPKTKELIVLRGDSQTVQKELRAIENPNAWIEVHLADDNPMSANQEIRELATSLALTILAVKIEKTKKELHLKEQKAISLDELSIREVFNRKLELEAIESEDFRNKIELKFLEVLEEVEA